LHIIITKQREHFSLNKRHQLYKALLFQDLRRILYEHIIL